MTTLLVTIFFSVLFFFGWEAARFFFSESRIERLLTLSIILGISFYLFFLNIAGFFIPIQDAFHTTLFMFLFLALVHRFYRRKHKASSPLIWELTSTQRIMLLAFALFLTLTVGLISFRHPMDLFTLREPTAATIAEGNFPPKEIWNPDNTLLYHYAPDLLSAAIHQITGAPLYMGYVFQKALLSGGIFLTGFLLVYSFIPGSPAIAFGSALGMLYAGSLVFLRGLNGFQTLFDTYVMGKSITAPFKFINDAIGEGFALPTINYLVQVYWGAMAFALILAVIYLYLEFLRGSINKRPLFAIIVIGFLYALLALVAESFFAILAGVLLIFPLIVWFKNHDRGKRACVLSFSILALAIPIALYQGGVLKSAVYQQLGVESADVMLYTDKNTNATPLKFTLPSYDNKPLYDFSFLEKWILLIVVFIPALVFLFKRAYELAIFLFIATLFFFIAPLVLHSDFRFIQDNLERFFYPVSVFGGLVAGAWLGSLYNQEARRGVKTLVIFVAFVFAAQGLWTHAIWTTLGYPPGAPWNPNASFFAKAGTLEWEAYTWVKGNTSIRDRFLILRDEYSECGFSGAPNCLFVLNTGRMAPIFKWHQAERIKDWKAAEKIDTFESLRETCSVDGIRALGYTHLYVDEGWPEGLEVACVKRNSPNLQFEIKKENRFIRIYSVQHENA